MNDKKDEVWPHHRRKSDGKMVRCKSNPCRIHSNGTNKDGLIDIQVSDSIADIVDMEISGFAGNVMASGGNYNAAYNALADDYNIHQDLNRLFDIAHNRKPIPNFGLNKPADTGLNKEPVPNDDNNVNNQSGNYAIYCSPVNRSDGRLQIAHKMSSFIREAEKAGIFKVMMANLTDSGNFRRAGVILECNVRNHQEFLEIHNKIQQLADDYDDGAGFTIFKKEENPDARSRVITVYDSDGLGKKLVDGYGFKSLHAYEYKDGLGRTCTMIPDMEKNNDIMNVIGFVSNGGYTVNNTDIEIIRRSR